MKFRAPATSANLGPGFDCAGVALDLWNELEIEERGDGGGPQVEVEGEGAEELHDVGVGHLGLKAFALMAPVEGWRFRFVNRIPLARGLGSSAATIAVGLVAGMHVARRHLTAEQLLVHALTLESHADNLAAALAGGVTFTWHERDRFRIARIAGRLPAAPIAVVPGNRVSTEEARSALPAEFSLHDASFTVGRAALLGAAAASGDEGLFAAALDDRLHQPYRAATATLFPEIRDNLPQGALGVTISGSGPTVIVWARRGKGEAVAEELAAAYPDARVLPLAVASEGAGPTT
jgi:homoserine kinase